MRNRILAMSGVVLACLGGVVALAQQPGISPQPLRPPVADPAPIALPPPGPPQAGVLVGEPLPAAPTDPTQSVEQFVQRSRKEADDAIKALTQEREALHARLQKVEAALQRWQQVADALNPAAPPAEMRAEAPKTERDVPLPPTALPPDEATRK